ncbi:MAG: hypothetical protein QOI07_32 [Verrucomicrobiota bacterium]
MEEVDAPAVVYRSRFEEDFPQKLKDVQKEYGSLAKFLEAQQSKPVSRFFAVPTLGFTKAPRRKSKLVR